MTCHSGFSISGVVFCIMNSATYNSLTPANAHKSLVRVLGVIKKGKDNSKKLAEQKELHTFAAMEILKTPDQQIIAGTFHLTDKYIKQLQEKEYPAGEILTFLKRKFGTSPAPHISLYIEDGHSEHENLHVHFYCATHLSLDQLRTRLTSGKAKEKIILAKRIWLRNKYKGNNITQGWATYIAKQATQPLPNFKLYTKRNATTPALKRTATALHREALKAAKQKSTLH